MGQTRCGPRTAAGPVAVVTTSACRAAAQAGAVDVAALVWLAEPRTVPATRALAPGLRVPW